MYTLNNGNEKEKERGGKNERLVGVGGGTEVRKRDKHTNYYINIYMFLVLYDISDLSAKTIP